MTTITPQDIEDFTNGGCGLLAEAIHDRTGWALATFWNGGQSCGHAFIQVPDGRYLDIAGLHTHREMLDSHWGQPGKRHGRRGITTRHAVLPLALMDNREALRARAAELAPVLITLADGEILPEITLTLTGFQAGEVQYGLDIDAADHHDEPPWGRVTPVGKRGYCLAIAGTQLARDRALYRITSSRDIALDNARDRLAGSDARLVYASHGRSLSGLTAKLVEAAGGPEGFSEDVRRWIRY